MRMVNVGFPAPSGYGFERVDAPGAAVSRRTAPSIENLHRIKSIGFFTNFRRIKLNANTCDLSTAVSQERIARSTATVARSIAVFCDVRNGFKERRPGSRDVFSASLGVLARAGARAVAQGKFA